MELKCIIIDDDILSINGLKAYISKIGHLEIIKAYTDSVEALTEIGNSSPVDLIFMDVDMPMISGIELSKAIRHKTHKLIFTTSHEKYGYQAFEVQANHYLLKPYSFANFAATLYRLFPQKEITIQDSSKEKEFFVRNKSDNNNLLKVLYENVIAIESLQNYIRIYTIYETIVTYISLSEIKHILSGYTNFMQVHRSFIISKLAIEKVEGNVLKLTNNIEVTIGSNYREEVMRYIKNKTIRTGRI